MEGGWIGGGGARKGTRSGRLRARRQEAAAVSAAPFTPEKEGSLFLRIAQATRPESGPLTWSICLGDLAPGSPTTRSSTIGERGRAPGRLAVGVAGGVDAPEGAASRALAVAAARKADAPMTEVWAGDSTEEGGKEGREKGRA